MGRETLKRGSEVEEAEVFSVKAERSGGVVVSSAPTDKTRQ